MKRDVLIEAVCNEITRIWPPSQSNDSGHGFEGTFEQYAWLRANYDVTEEDDNRWQDILAFECGDEIDIEPDEEAELYEFLNDDDAVSNFLRGLLTRYRNGTAAYGVGAAGVES